MFVKDFSLKDDVHENFYDSLQYECIIYLALIESFSFFIYIYVYFRF